VSRRIDQLSIEFGHVGDERLLLMAALLISDELLEARAKLATLGDGEDTSAGSTADTPSALPVTLSVPSESTAVQPKDEVAYELAADAIDPAPQAQPMPPPPPEPRAVKRPIVKSAIEERIAAAKAQSPDRKVS
jgi:cell division protein ZapA (FtsZ GTPase activity inhibitor)